MASDNFILTPGASIKPLVAPTDVQRILQDVYGLKCLSIKELNGYDDKNYHVKAEMMCDNKFIANVCNSGYTLKVVNALDSEKGQFIEAQSEVLIYLGDKGICCPQPVQTKDGKHYTITTLSSGNHAVRLLEFVEGKILHQVPSSDELFFQAGKYVAQLDEALKNFYHLGYDNHTSIWSLNSVPELKQFLFAIKDKAKREIVEEVIEEFCKRVLPARKNFEKGMIHGDYNEQNILVEQKDNKWNIKGVLDFGDSHISYYIYELAIAMTYMIIQGRSINVGGTVLAGYNSIRKVPPDEFNLLKVLIAARICQSVVMASYSILQEPNNDYILTTSRFGWSILEQLWAEPEAELLERWKSVIIK